MNLVADNAAARDRILSLVAHLTDEQMATGFEGGWTIAAELAHLAFWDRVSVGRLRAALGAGGDLPKPFAAETFDAINDAGLPAWRLIGGGQAVELFAQASEEVDTYVASLDPLVVDRILAAGVPRLVERYHHRTDHADAIERSLQRP